jgi:hypothetical protein
MVGAHDVSCSKHIAIASFVLALFAPGGSYAQAIEERAATTIGSVHFRTSRTLFAVGEAPAGIRQSVATADVSGLSSERTWTRATQTPAQPRDRSAGRKVLGGILGGVGGFFGGGYLGAAIEGDSCHCDDPGLMGALIGAPVGAAVGAILGVAFF